MLHGAKRLGLSARFIHDKSGASALSTLRAELITGRPVALSVDMSQHWILALGVLGTGFVVVDSARWSGNVEELGTSVLDAISMRERWRSVGGFFGVAVGRRRPTR